MAERRRAAAVLAVLLALGAPATAAGEAVPVPGPVLRVANPGKAASLDPHRITGVWENRIVGDMFMGLTTEGADGSVQPGAAESWTLSPDGRVYTFRIREHAWSDGRPVTAADFAWSFRRMLAPETACAYADFFFVIEGARRFTAGAAGAEAVGVRALDARTLEIRLTRPVAYFPGLLMHFAAMPVPRHALEAHGDAWTDPDRIVVNGPFRLHRRIPNERVELRRNPRFYAADTVALGGVTYFPQENRDAAVQRYRSGGLEVVRDFPSGKAEWLRQRFGDEVVRTEPYLGLTYLAVNHRHPALADPRVREALSLALDRRIITRRVLGSGERAALSLVPPGAAHYDAPARFAYADWPRERRLERARALMTEAGFGAGRPLELELRLRTSENDRRVALAAQSMWKPIFVALELVRAETAIHYARLADGSFDLGLASWLAVYDDPQTFTLLAETGAGANNLGRYDNPRYDALTGAAAGTVDLAARAALLRRAEALALAEHALIPVFHHAGRNLVAPAVTGWIPNVLDVHRSRYLGLE